MGYAFAHGRLMDVLKGWKKPWTLNRLGEAAAIASLRDADYREKTLCLINEERRFLYDGLSSFPFLKPLSLRRELYSSLGSVMALAPARCGKDFSRKTACS